MIREARLLLRENPLLKRTVYPIIVWFADRVLNVRQRLIKKYGWQVVREIDSAAKSSMMPYGTCFGTLLGLVREKNFIKYDTDMDFAIYGKNFKAFFSELERRGFKFERYILIDSHLKEFSVRYNEVCIDFFNNSECSDDGLVWGLFAEKVGDEVGYLSLPKPTALVETEIRGCRIVMPENWDAILRGNYGDYWHPVKEWDDSMSPSYRVVHRNYEIMLSRDRDEWVSFLRDHGCQ